jgi:dihydroflavonol-4-reductase
MARSLVTGGSGFVGRHLVDTLRARGDAVRILDIAPLPAGASGVEFLCGSVDDRDAVVAALDGVDCVYHLAGIAHFWRRDPDDFDRVNRRGTEVVLEAAAERGTARVVHCSTESILLPPRRGGRAIDESAPPALSDMPGPYTRSKYRAEQAALEAARRGGDVVVVNPTVPIGDGDHNRTPPAEMFELFLSGRSPFYLDCVLNLVDVRDLAEGIALAAERGRAGERYILGGENLALSDLLPILERLSGRKMPRHTVPSSLALLAGTVAGWIADRVTHSPPKVTREGVVVALRSAPFDSEKAKRELGYAPRSIAGALTEVVGAFKRKVSGETELGTERRSSAF